MKKLLTMIVLLIVAHQSFCQTGLKAGLTYTSMSPSERETSYVYDFKLGFYAGVFSTIGLSEKLALQPELLLSVKGSKLTGTFTPMPPSIRNPVLKHNLYYLTLPFLLRYEPIPKLTLVAGPEAGFLVRAYQKSQEREGRSLSEYNTFDIGASVGGSYQVTAVLAAEIRYTHGFRENEAQTNTLNRAFQAGLVYQLFR